MHSIIILKLNRKSFKKLFIIMSNKSLLFPFQQVPPALPVQASVTNGAMKAPPPPAPEEPPKLKPMARKRLVREEKEVPVEMPRLTRAVHWQKRADEAFTSLHVTKEHKEVKSFIARLYEVQGELLQSPRSSASAFPSHCDKSFIFKFSKSSYLNSPSSESIHIWTIGTLECRLSFHIS